MATLWDLKSIVLREQSSLLITPKLGESGGMFFILHIRNPLKEEERKDVSFEVRSINRAAKNVRGLP